MNSRRQFLLGSLIAGVSTLFFKKKALSKEKDMLSKLIEISDKERSWCNEFEEDESKSIKWVLNNLTNKELILLRRYLSDSYHYVKEYDVCINKAGMREKYLNENLGDTWKVREYIITGYMPKERIDNNILNKTE
jgi:hypothetical protein